MPPRTSPHVGLLAVVAALTLVLAGCSSATPGPDDHATATPQPDDHATATPQPDDHATEGTPIEYACDDGTRWNNDACNRRLYLQTSTDLYVVDSSSHAYVDSLDVTTLGSPCAIDLAYGYAYFLENVTGGHAIARYDLSGQKIVAGPVVTYDHVDDAYLGLSGCSVTDQRDVVMIRTHPEDADGGYAVGDPNLYIAANFASETTLTMEMPASIFFYPQDGGAPGTVLMVGDDGDGANLVGYEVDLASGRLRKTMEWPVDLDVLTYDHRTQTMYLANNFDHDPAQLVVARLGRTPFAVNLPDEFSSWEVDFAFFDPATSLPVFELGSYDDPEDCAFMTLTSSDKLKLLDSTEQFCNEYRPPLPGSSYVTTRQDDPPVVVDYLTGRVVGTSFATEKGNIRYLAAQDAFNDEEYFWTNDGELFWHNFTSDESGIVAGVHGPTG